MNTTRETTNDLENSSVLEKEYFKQNADFIYSRWVPVHISDFKTHVLDVGRGEPIVVVPICQGLEVFDSLLIQALSKEYRVITYQRREDEKKKLDINNRADDLKKVLNHLQIEKAHFISHSSGSVATTTLALKHPELFLSYVWMNLSAKPTSDMSFWKKQIALLVQYLPLPDLILLKMLAGTCAGGKKNSLLYKRVFEQFAAIKSAGVSSIKKWFVNNVWTMAEYDWTRGLEKLTIPTLVMNSNNDLVNSIAAMKDIEKQLPNSYGFVTVKGGWHFFQYLSSVQVLKSIRGFYSDLAKS